MIDVEILLDAFFFRNKAEKLEKCNEQLLAACKEIKENVPLGAALTQRLEAAIAEAEKE
ncbi:MAG: hypothetical protein KKD77_21210 [Gammaproteobacteria bacterium]|nr:hypothetical protein [Gammaproteobacteria bacterium]